MNNEQHFGTLRNSDSDQSRLSRRMKIVRKSQRGGVEETILCLVKADAMFSKIRRSLLGIPNKFHS